MKWRRHSISSSFVALALLVAPDAHKADCGDLGERYNTAVSKVLDALKGYEKCVSGSNKRDDCANEIEALDAAHDDFADAIDDSKTCR